MTGHAMFTPHILKNSLTLTKYTVVFALILSPLISHATPQNMGKFKIINRNVGAGTANGTYTTPQGATGSFTITRNETSGYDGMSFTPGNDNVEGINGIEIRNSVNTGVSEDKFKYTFAITPDDPNSIHTIKIGQASYATTGNSEVARQTLSFTQSNNSSIPVRAFVKHNPSNDYFYNAMGDYFMGTKVANKENTFLANQSIREPQLRQNDSGAAGTTPINKLYYFAISELKGTGSNPYTLTLNNGTVEFNNRKGQLPPTPTVNNILKSNAQPDKYPALSENNNIANNGSYVSYGVENINSNYVIAVENAKSVTLTYEGIMNGHTGSVTDVFGETYSEWISFGVEGVPNYIFSGTVFNDNGGITNKPNAQYDISSTFTGNASYFNGLFDSSELGIYNSALQVRLTDCKGGLIPTLSSTPNPQTVSSQPSALGTYRFTVLPEYVESTTSLCIEEIEPSNWQYSVDTTPNKHTIPLLANTYVYANINFGEVEANQTALVLKKYQYVHECNDNLNYTTINSGVANPIDGFSMNAAGDVKPGNCIAYKIEAHNRGHIDLTDIQISDTLQNVAVKSIFHLPKPLGSPADVFQSNNITAIIGENGTIQSNRFSLPKVINSGSSTVKSLYFNSKYGLTQSN